MNALRSLPAVLGQIKIPLLAASHLSDFAANRPSLDQILNVLASVTDKRLGALAAEARMADQCLPDRPPDA